MTDELRRSIERAAAALREAGAREVYLFGSAASGQMRPGSDVDLAVSGLPPQRFYRLVCDVGEILGRPLSLVDLDEDNAFTRYLREEGVLQRVG